MHRRQFRHCLAFSYVLTLTCYLIDLRIIAQLPPVTNSVLFSGHQFHTVHQAKCEDGGPRIRRWSYLISVAMLRYDFGVGVDAARLPLKSSFCRAL